VPETFLIAARTSDFDIFGLYGTAPFTAGWTGFADSFFERRVFEAAIGRAPVAAESMGVDQVEITSWVWGQA